MLNTAVAQRIFPNRYRDLLAHSRAMRRIALGESDAFQIPALDDALHGRGATK
jgi:hypothetical protein